MKYPLTPTQPTYFATEAQLQSHLIKWIKHNWPRLHFRCDWFADHYCPPHIKEQYQAAQSGSDEFEGTGYPDLHIVHNNGIYPGLYIETKLSADKAFRKDGVTLLSSQHLWNQFCYHTYLKAQGYAVIFGLGELHIKSNIVAYMAGNRVEQEIKAVPYIDKHRAASDNAADEFQRQYDLDNPDFMATPFG